MASLKLSKILSGVCIHKPRVTLEGSQVSFEKTGILQFSQGWQCPKLTLFSQKVWPLQTSELANSRTKLVDEQSITCRPPIPLIPNPPEQVNCLWEIHCFCSSLACSLLPKGQLFCLLFHLGITCGRLTVLIC